MDKVQHGWAFNMHSTDKCDALTQGARPCNNIAKWFRNSVGLCPSHCRQRVKAEKAEQEQVESRFAS